MNCDEYVDGLLSAHADGQLSESERRLADEHLRGCPQCRLQLAEEQALKASIRRHAGMIKTPGDVRLRIRAALGEISERRRRHVGALATMARSLGKPASRPPVSLVRPRVVSKPGNSAAYRAGSARGWLATQVTRAQYLAPLAVVVITVAIATVLSTIGFRSMSRQVMSENQESIPAFDFAVDRFNQLSQEFTPNVPPEAFSREGGAYFAWVEDTNPLRHVSAELPDISVSYEKMQMPPEFCDFAQAGYELAGGRVDRLPDGEPVTYTLYRNGTESLLSIGLKQRLSAPHGGYWFGNHAMYSYQGYSICLTIYPVGHFASIIVTHGTMVELLSDVAASEIGLQDR
jgi:hypothetical protein